MKIAKKILLIAGICIIFPLAALIGYDVLCFMPHRADMRELLSAADSENRHPPRIVTDLIYVASQNGTALATNVARHLLVRYTKAAHYKMMAWHVSFLLWDGLVRLHLSKEEQYAYYCLLSFNGKDYGVNELSTRLFAKPLSQLNEKEAVTVIATLASPSYFSNNQEALKDYQDQLLAELAAGHRKIK
ncbi:MAG: transglycosylase domain-containing protein [Methylovulum sp.]|nr:transglycosylase domain-containing protein [Methylovulum sp.]